MDDHLEAQFAVVHNGELDPNSGRLAAPSVHAARAIAVLIVEIFAFTALRVFEGLRKSRVPSAASCCPRLVLAPLDDPLSEIQRIFATLFHSLLSPLLPSSPTLLCPSLGNAAFTSVCSLSHPIVPDNVDQLFVYPGLHRRASRAGADFGGGSRAMQNQRHPNRPSRKLPLPSPVSSRSHSTTWRQSERYADLLAFRLQRDSYTFSLRHSFLLPTLYVHIAVYQVDGISLQYQELDSLVRDWIRPPPDAVFGLRVPKEYVSIATAVSLIYCRVFVIVLTWLPAIGLRTIHLCM